MKKAEDAVIVAESTLAKTQRDIGEQQEALNYSLSHGHSSSTIKERKTALKELTAQGLICQERAEAARQDLDKLVRQSQHQSGTKIRLNVQQKPKE